MLDHLRNMCGVKSKIVVTIISSVFALALSNCALASGYKWWPPVYANKITFPSLKQACEYSVKRYYQSNWPPGGTYELVSIAPFDPYWGYATCYIKGYYQGSLWGNYSISIARAGSCAAPSSEDPATGDCTGGALKQKGLPETLSCEASTSPVAGNPINFAIGNKFQIEPDYSAGDFDSLQFIRTYNSEDGVWRHNYSASLRISASKVVLTHSDGRESYFSINGENYTPDPDEFGRLDKSGDSWTYSSADNQRLTFDKLGRLTALYKISELQYSIAYGDEVVVVTGKKGSTISFKQDAMLQPTSFTAQDLEIEYFYDSWRRLTKVSWVRPGQTKERIYHYTPSSTSLFLLGITDERGVRYATWTYDDYGRATSSTHAGGAGKVFINYNSDGSSTVTNELGRKTVYRFQVIQGVKRIVAIEGEPSASCPASNSTFTYNDRGQVLSKTDAKGFITTYTYNDRGLETSRTEASGTPQARTTTTTWHATFNLPLTVTEPGQQTTYTYDAQGRQTSRTQTAL